MKLGVDKWCIVWYYVYRKREEIKTMTRKVYFDMDGTIANLYAVEGWLESLRAERTKPYREAKPMVNMRALGRELNRLQEAGYIIGVITWLSKDGTEEYNARTTETKKKWLEKHLGAVNFDEFHALEYGTPKEFYGEGILFDDEEYNRKEWAKYENNLAFGVENILEILEKMC